MPVPTEIKLRRQSNLLEVCFDAEVFALSAEFLRVHSPSAEVRGHGPNSAQLPTGKIHVALTGVEPQGNYAVRLIFNDGHSSGIYTWAYLYDLGRNQQHYWQAYLDALTAAAQTRDPDTAVVKIVLGNSGTA